MADATAALVLVGHHAYEFSEVIGTVSDLAEAVAWVETPGDRLRAARYDTIRLQIVGGVQVPDLRVVAAWEIESQGVPDDAVRYRRSDFRVEWGPETPG